MQKTILRDEINIVFESPIFPSGDDLAEKYGVQDSSVQQLNALHDNQLNDQGNNFLQNLKSLQIKIDEKNREIESLCVMLEALEPLPGMNPLKYKGIIDGDCVENVDFRDSKIVSLAKKSHNLSMLLNKERSGNEELRVQVKGLKNDVELAKHQTITTTVKPIEAKGYGRYQKSCDDYTEDTAGKVLSLTKDLRESTKLIEELKRKNILQSDENKNLAKALNRELGDGVSLEQAVDGGWRGRAQQIIMLKSKVKKLEKALNDSNTGDTATAVLLDVDSRAQEDIAGMSNVRRRIVDALTEERVSLSEANQTLERKTNAQKARINILESEIRKLKENFQVVLGKSATDDELLEMLRGEVTRLKTQIKTQSAAAAIIAASSVNDDRRNESREITDAQYQSEICRLQRLCKNQTEQIDSQDQTIRHLKKRLT